MRGPQRAKRSDRGAAVSEYVATLVLVAMIAVAALVLIPNPVGNHVRVAVCKIFSAMGIGGNCSENPIEYKPPPAACILSSDSHKVGGSVTVFDVKIGNNFQLVRTKTADGKVKIMVVPIDFKLGAEALVGEKTAGGNFGLKAGAKVEGTVNLKYGDTWVFNNDEEANHFVNDMRSDWVRHEAEKVSPGLWIWDRVTGWEPSTPDPQINQWEVGVEGVLNGSVGFGQVTDTNGTKSIKDVGTGIEVEGKAGDSVAVTRDNSKPDDPGYPRTSYTFTVKGSVKGGARVLGYGTDGSATYQGQTRVTYDKNGRLVSITYITTHEETNSEGYKNPGSVKGSGKGSDKQVSVTTTTINFDDSNRHIGEQWIRDNAFVMPFQAVRNAFDPDASYTTRDPGPGAGDFDRLLYNNAQVSKTVYQGDVDEFKIEAKVGAEFTFGFDAGYEHENQQVVSAQYLGAPQNGVRRFQDWPECRTG